MGGFVVLLAVWSHAKPGSRGCGSGCGCGYEHEHEHGHGYGHGYGYEYGHGYGCKLGAAIVRQRTLCPA